MYISFPKKGIRLNLLVPLGVGFLVLLNGLPAFIAIFLAAAVHEGGHILAAFLCGVSVDRFDIELWGGRMYYGGMQSYPKELAISVGGIAANLALAPLGLFSVFGIYGKLYFAACICYALVNLLPAKTLDGGEAARILLSMRYDEYAAFSAISTLNSFSVLFMCGAGLVLSLLSGMNSSVIMLAVITVVLSLEK